MSEPKILKCRECGEYGPILFHFLPSDPKKSVIGWYVHCKNCDRSTGICKSRLAAVRAHNKQIREEMT